MIIMAENNGDKNDGGGSSVIFPKQNVSIIEFERLVECKLCLEIQDSFTKLFLILVQLFSSVVHILTDRDFRPGQKFAIFVSLYLFL